MDGMTTQERYNDISERTGLSVDIIKRVLIAERESIVDTLKKGERSALIGRCVIRPELKSKLVIGGELRNYIDLKAEVASSLKSSLEEMGDFEISNEEMDNKQEGIRLRQIPSLI